MKMDLSSFGRDINFATKIKPDFPLCIPHVIKPDCHTDNNLIVNSGLCN
jgi:hypothetical protein